LICSLALTSDMLFVTNASPEMAKVSTCYYRVKSLSTDLVLFTALINKQLNMLLVEPPCTFVVIVIYKS